MSMCCVIVQDSSRLQQAFGYLLLIMIMYFILSIVNSMAQSYAKRLDEEEIRLKHTPSSKPFKTD